ncbi:MAG TPA: hypothetical protein VKD23_20935 [Terriglobales bacterium]|nr:hypothetical protein [Terriglobales bacterium]
MVVGIALDRLPTPAVVGIRIPAVTPAPVAAIITVAAAIITVVAATVAAIITAAVEGITLGDSIRDVLPLDMLPESIVPNSTNFLANLVVAGGK